MRGLLDNPMEFVDRVLRHVYKRGWEDHEDGVYKPKEFVSSGPEKMVDGP